MSISEPLDLWNVLVSTFSGNIEIFFIIAMIATIGMTAFFRMPLEGMFAILFLFTAVMAYYIQLPLILMVMLGGIPIAFLLARLFKS